MMTDNFCEPRNRSEPALPRTNHGIHCAFCAAALFLIASVLRLGQRLELARAPTRNRVDRRRQSRLVDGRCRLAHPAKDGVPQTTTPQTGRHSGGDATRPTFTVHDAPNATAIGRRPCRCSAAAFGPVSCYRKRYPPLIFHLIHQVLGHTDSIFLRNRVHLS